MVPALVVGLALGGGSATAARFVTGKQVKDGSLTLKDFKKSERRKLLGRRGALGPRGPQGFGGAQGSAGATGPAGARGPGGLNGTNGLNGVNGADGADGAPGPAGSDGADGAPGPAGSDGADGAPGPAGADGADGADGAPGAQGPQGPPGEDATALWAFVDIDGSLFRSSGTATQTNLERNPSTGRFDIKFTQSVSNCSAVATAYDPGETRIRDMIGDTVTVNTYLSDGSALADKAFHLAVFC